MSILTNQERYGKMVEALNNFYWDNGITPNETAARLDEFAGECTRLAKYIRDNEEMPDNAPSNYTLEPSQGQTCPVCGGDGKQNSGVRGQRECIACDGTGQV